MSPLVISRMRTTRIFSLPHYYRNRSMTGEQSQQWIWKWIMNRITLSSSLEWLRPGMGGPKVDCNQDHLHSLAPPEFRYGLFPERLDVAPADEGFEPSMPKSCQSPQIRACWGQLWALTYLCRKRDSHVIWLSSSDSESRSSSLASIFAFTTQLMSFRHGKKSERHT